MSVRLLAADPVEEYPRRSDHPPSLVGSGMVNQPKLNQRPTVRLLRDGDLVAEVAVTLVDAEKGWTPYLLLEDSCKLDDVRAALRAGDVRRVAKVADRVYRLTPVQAERT